MSHVEAIQVSLTGFFQAKRFLGLEAPAWNSRTPATGSEGSCSKKSEVLEDEHDENDENDWNDWNDEKNWRAHPKIFGLSQNGISTSIYIPFLHCLDLLRVHDVAVGRIASAQPWGLFLSRCRAYTTWENWEKP